MSAEQRDRVNRLVQAPPAQAAEPAHHAVGRGRGQRRKPQPRDRANDEIDAVRDLVKKLGEAVALVGEEQRKVRGDVAERADAEHAAHIDQVAVAEDVAERRHRQRHAEKHQRPETGAMDQLVERPRAVRNRACLQYRLGERHQQKREHGDAQIADSRPRRSRHNSQDFVAGSLMARTSDMRCQNDANSSETAVDSWFSHIIWPFSARYLLRPINVSNRMCVVPFSSRLDSSRRYKLASKRFAATEQNHAANCYGKRRRSSNRPQ